MNVSDSAAQTHDDAIGHGAIYRGLNLNRPGFRGGRLV